MARIELPYGSRTHPLTLPDEWLGEIALPRSTAPAPNVNHLITSALQHPIGCLPLSQRVKRSNTVAVIVDDFTRKTPVHVILPVVLKELHASGIEPDQIRIIIALGTHRPMTPSEITEKLGADVAHRYPVVNVPSTSDSDMVYLGCSTIGIPAWVNRAAADADFRIGLGMITPHLEAGFTGGAKIILPGVCSSRTVDAFHSVSAFIPENQLGNVNTPLRQNLEQFVAERVPLHFIVNVIITLEGQVYQCVAGDCVKAHRAGVRYAQEVFGTPVSRRYPIVVASSYPYDMDWWQSAKGVWAGDWMTADGGTLIIVTASPEGNSNYPLVPYYTGRDPEELCQEIKAGTATDAKQASAGAMFGNLRRRINFALVSDGLNPTDADAMRMPYFTSVDQAVADAIGRLPENERKGAVGVMPYAGIVLPILK